VLIKKEGGHAQWTKQGINVGVLIALILMNLFLGSSSKPSIIGVKNCSPIYWLIYALFIVICLATTALATYLAKREQSLKQEFGNVNMVTSDVILNRKNLITLMILGFFGGLLAGAFGLGGGVIFNPVLLSLGLPPMVAAASGLYLVTFSKIATAVVYLIYGQLDLPYGFWLSFCATFGSVMALFFARWYERVSGRQSFIVWLLVFDFILGIAIIASFGSISLKQTHDHGISITAFSPICKK
jgi:uncharacterized membrane protein YfcA